MLPPQHNLPEFRLCQGVLPSLLSLRRIFTEEEEEHSPTVNVGTEDINTDDANLQIESSPNFHQETGMWEFKALSKHRPHTNMLDVNLVGNTQEKNDIVISTNFDPTYGVYRNAELKPHHL